MLQAAAPAPEELQGGIAWSGNVSGTGETGTGQQSRARRATDAAMSIWKRASSRLFDLESKIVMQVRCTRLCCQAWGTPSSLVLSRCVTTLASPRSPVGLLRMYEIQPSARKP